MGSGKLVEGGVPATSAEPDPPTPRMGLRQQRSRWHSRLFWRSARKLCARHLAQEPHRLEYTQRPFGAERLCLTRPMDHNGCAPTPHFVGVAPNSAGKYMEIVKASFAFAVANGGSVRVVANLSRLQKPKVLPMLKNAYRSATKN